MNRHWPSDKGLLRIAAVRLLKPFPPGKGSSGFRFGGWKARDSFPGLPFVNEEDSWAK